MVAGRQIDVEKTVAKEFGGIKFELRIMKSEVPGGSGAFAHVFPRIPCNALAVEVIRWAKEEIRGAGKKVEHVFYYVHREIRSEAYERIPYGELSIMFSNGE